MSVPQSHTLDLTLLARLYQAREEERCTLAGELHDRLSQQLASLKMDIFRLDRKLQPKDDYLTKKLTGMMELVDAAVESIRNISAELHPGVLDDAGLAAAMEWYTREFIRQFAVQAAFTSDPLPFGIIPEISINLFRIYQGLLARSLTSPGLQQITASLVCTDISLMLTLREDRWATIIEHPQTRPMLPDLAGRILLLSGECSFDDKPGNASSICICIPIEKLLTPYLKPIS